jgi:hypothetical protein
MRIIAIIDSDSLGLVAESEVLGLNDETASALVQLGYAKKYDDTKPMVGKSVNVYETKSYPIDRQVFHNDSIYKSNCITSATWVPSEWDCIVHGANAV